MGDGRRTAASRIANAIVETARLGGADPDVLCEAVGLEPTVLADPDGRLPHEQLLALFEVAAAQTGDPDFGLHAAEHIPTTAFGVLGYVALSAANLGEAFDRVCRCFRVLVDGEHLRFEVAGDSARFWHEFTEPERQARHSQEFSLATALINARRLCGLDFAPQLVCFPHARPPDVTSHEHLFRCPLEFGSPVAQLVFPRGLLDRPLLSQDPELHAILERHVDDLLSRLPARETFAARVRRELSTRLAGCAPGIDEVAEMLGLSRRTLQRRLAASGTTYSALLDETRHALAVHYLDDPDTSLSELAFLLGFSEVSTFHRAFVRWTDTTPAAFRRRRR